MITIVGFEAAKKSLERQAGNGYGRISPAVAQRTESIFGEGITPELAVNKIIDDVREKGDSALRKYTKLIDGIQLKSFEVPKNKIKAAYDKADNKLVAALETAAERIRRFHQEQKDSVWHEVRGIEWGQVMRPLEKAGLYIPGGTAAYPSTVLATAVPAKVAGVEEIIITSPPSVSGEISPNTLAAAYIAGVNRVFNLGGAQAIAALAYGTESVPRVDKICGPGNVFVMLAKKRVFGDVAIDALQGPSEVLVICDSGANASYCAADLLAQAEHDTLARTVLISTSKAKVKEIKKELDNQLKDLPRHKIAGESLEHNGTLIAVNKISEAIELANIFAPEHLELIVNNPERYLEKIKNAGCVFIGEYSTEPIGDYIAGPSHALPTGGTARFSSPLNVLDFVKIIDIVRTDKAGIERLGPAAMTIARAEGLEAHARAIEKRLQS